MKAGHFLKGIFIAFILFSVIMPSKHASAAELTAHQDFSNKLSVELTNYIKKSGGTVTHCLHYVKGTSGPGEFYQVYEKRWWSVCLSEWKKFNRCQ
ncbi:hypothetical protein [Bacillus sp. OV166]|uniref:hypothetical protein n=1 Tax=Bacillus sp. OV166 TaxID=1882763 RepID=UPI0015C50F35|nr:hypothetical protein [Bacillus sp. OV166]